MTYWIIITALVIFSFPLFILITLPMLITMFILIFTPSASLIRRRRRKKS